MIGAKKYEGESNINEIFILIFLFELEEKIMIAYFSIGIIP